MTQKAHWLCRWLGIHKWSVWTPMHEQLPGKAGEEFPNCQERVCLRCNLEITRFWDDDYK